MSSQRRLSGFVQNGLFVLVSTLFVLLIGQLAGAPIKDGVFDHLLCKSFAIVDDSGNPAVFFSLKAGEPVFAMIGENGSLRAANSALFFFDHEDRQIVSIGNDAGTGELALSGKAKDQAILSERTGAYSLSFMKDEGVSAMVGMYPDTNSGIIMLTDSLGLPVFSRGEITYGD